MLQMFQEEKNKILKENNKSNFNFLENWFLESNIDNKLYSIFNRCKYFSECKSSTKKFFQWGQRWALYMHIRVV